MEVGGQPERTRTTDAHVHAHAHRPSPIAHRHAHFTCNMHMHMHRSFATESAHRPRGTRGGWASPRLALAAATGAAASAACSSWTSSATLTERRRRPCLGPSTKGTLGWQEPMRRARLWPMDTPSSQHAVCRREPLSSVLSSARWRRCGRRSMRAGPGLLGAAPRSGCADSHEGRSRPAGRQAISQWAGGAFATENFITRLSNIACSHRCQMLHNRALSSSGILTIVHERFTSRMFVTH